MATKRLLDEKTRLSVAVMLAKSDREITFSNLRERLEMTDGNLSVHIAKMVADGVIGERKEFVSRRPQTSYWITDLGRKELRDHLARFANLTRGVMPRLERSLT